TEREHYPSADFPARGGRGGRGGAWQRWRSSRCGRRRYDRRNRRQSSRYGRAHWRYREKSDRFAQCAPFAFETESETPWQWSQESIPISQTKKAFAASVGEEARKEQRPQIEQRASGAVGQIASPWQGSVPSHTGAKGKAACCESGCTFWRLHEKAGLENQTTT